MSRHSLQQWICRKKLIQMSGQSGESDCARKRDVRTAPQRERVLREEGKAGRKKVQRGQRAEGEVEEREKKGKVSIGSAVSRSGEAANQKERHGRVPSQLVSECPLGPEGKWRARPAESGRPSPPGSSSLLPCRAPKDRAKRDPLAAIVDRQSPPRSQKFRLRIQERAPSCVADARGRIPGQGGEISCRVLRAINSDDLSTGLRPRNKYRSCMARVLRPWSVDFNRAGRC